MTKLLFAQAGVIFDYIGQKISRAGAQRRREGGTVLHSNTTSDYTTKVNVERTSVTETQLYLHSPAHILVSHALRQYFSKIKGDLRLTKSRTGGFPIHLLQFMLREITNQSSFPMSTTET